MLRHRLSIPALLIVGVYVIALAVAAVFALAALDGLVGGAAAQ
ncbi:hypothetical protein [Nonomuraea sp. NPDC050786]